MATETSSRVRVMDKQLSFQGLPVEKEPSVKGVLQQQSSFKHRRGIERHPTFHGVTFEKQPAMEKQKSIRGLLEKQKSFRAVMERQLSFMGGGGSSNDKRKYRDSPGKKGDSPLHLAARTGNLSRVKEILHNCDGQEAKKLLSNQNQEGETPLYVAAENGYSMVVSELLKHMDLQTASVAARNGYDPFHVAARQGHLGKPKSLCFILI